MPTSSDLDKEIPGPGHYNAEKVDIFPIYKYKPSSVFVSKVARDTHHKLRGSSQLLMKPQSATAPIDDDYYDEDEDEYAPGPGSYYNQHASTTFKVKNVPERLQFFGSTVERFQEKVDKNKLPPNVGPGSYSVQGGAGNQKKMRTHMVPF